MSVANAILRGHETGLDTVFAAQWGADEPRLLSRTAGRVEPRGAGDLTSASAWRTARAAAPRPDPCRRQRSGVRCPGPEPTIRADWRAWGRVRRRDPAGARLARCAVSVPNALRTTAGEAPGPEIGDEQGLRRFRGRALHSCWRGSAARRSYSPRECEKCANTLFATRGQVGADDRARRGTAQLWIGSRTTHVSTDIAIDVDD
jgi:hypothetical protein